MNETKKLRYSQPSKLEMEVIVSHFIKYEKWASKQNYNHFKGDIVSFLGPRRQAYDEDDCKYLIDIYHQQLE